MKVIFVLLVTSLAVVNTNNISADIEVITKDDEHDVTTKSYSDVTSSSEEKRGMRPIFPKISQKFIVTRKPTTVRNITTPIIRSSNKQVFKIVPIKTKSKNYWKTTTTRPSLMKRTKFTVNPRTTLNTRRYPITSIKHSEEDEVMDRKYKINKPRKAMKTSDEDDSSEEILETSTANEKLQSKTKHVKTLIHRFHKKGSKISEDKYIENISKTKVGVEKLNSYEDVTTNKIKQSDADFSSEEEEDRKEFIFVTSNKVKEHTSAVKVAEDNESDETTTSILEKEFKWRPKRSNNVIEEENLGTTISGFKFTGKVASLSSDLVFKNINT